MFRNVSKCQQMSSIFLMLYYLMYVMAIVLQITHKSASHSMERKAFVHLLPPSANIGVDIVDTSDGN